MKYLLTILCGVLVVSTATSCEMSDDMTPMSSTSITNRLVIYHTSTNISTNTIYVSVTNTSTNTYTNNILATNTTTNIVTNTISAIITNMIRDLFDDPKKNIDLVEGFFPRKEAVYQKIYGQKPNFLYENFYIYDDGQIGIILSAIQNNLYSVSGFLGRRVDCSLNSVSIKQKGSTTSIDKSLYKGYTVCIVTFDIGSTILGVARSEGIAKHIYLMKIENSFLRIIPLHDAGIFYQIAGDEKVLNRLF
ncbi:MAG: hypothetical protein ACRCY4_08395 [Brevinema sp.]